MLHPCQRRGLKLNGLTKQPPIAEEIETCLFLPLDGDSCCSLAPAAIFSRFSQFPKAENINVKFHQDKIMIEK